MGCSQSIPTVDHASFLLEYEKKLFGANPDAASKFKSRYNVIKKVSEGPLSSIYMVTKVLHSSIEVLSDDNSHPENGVLVMQIIPAIRHSMGVDIVRMQKLKHSSILRIFDVHIDEDKSGIAIVTELCTGEDLESIVPCDEFQAKEIARQIVEAVAHMHSMGHFGHDLSTENIMFADDAREKIKISYAGLPVASIESNAFSSPAKKDIAEVGTVTYRLLTGKELSLPTGEVAHDLLFSSADDISKEAKNFVVSCITGSDRFDISMAAQHDWFTKSPTLEESIVSMESLGDEVHTRVMKADLEDTDTTIEISDDSMDAVRVCASSDSASEVSESAFSAEDILAETSVMSSSTQSGSSTSSNNHAKPRRIMSLSEKLEGGKSNPESSLSPSELQELRDVFYDLQSTKSDGEVTVKDVKEIFNRRVTGYTEDEVNSWFQGDKFDDSRNIKYTEFLDEAIQSRRKLACQRPEDTFQQFDKGSRGFVTVGNLRALLGTSNSEKIGQLIKEASSRKDGTITYERFEEVFARWNDTEQ